MQGVFFFRLLMKAGSRTHIGTSKTVP